MEDRNYYDEDFGNLCELGNNFDDDVEEIAEIVNRAVNRKPYTVLPRENHFLKWGDEEFFKRFRLTKRSVEYLLTQIEPQIRKRTERNNAVSPMLQLLMALRFYATGDMLISIGDFGGIHRSTVSKMIWNVTDAIARLRRRWIRFPTTEEEMTQTKQEFYTMARFPRVIGCIDCTHVRILSPGGPEAEVFRNRKHYFSLNVQAIAGPRLQVQNIVARWPGSAHDSNIFSQSTINARFEAGQFGDSLLLGDAGYPATNFLMTPLPATHNAAEELYNESHIRTRNSVERLFGVIKRRFPVLSIGMRVDVPKVQNVIVASCVLHNIAIHFKEDDPPMDLEVRIPNLEQPEVIDEAYRAEDIRQQLIQNYFLPLTGRV